MKKKKSAGKNPHYTREFKAEAVRRYHARGNMSADALAAKLGCSSSTLYAWATKAKPPQERRKGTPPVPPPASLLKRADELRAQNALLFQQACNVLLRSLLRSLRWEP